MQRFVSVVGMAVLLGAGTISAAPLAVKSVKASSQLPDAQGRSFAPQQIVDGQLSTYWAEGEASAGLGDWIELQLEGDTLVDRIDLWPGNWDSKEFFQRHNRLKSVQFKFSDGSSQKFDLKDVMGRQSFTLPAPVKTRFVRMVLKDIYPGSTFNDTCLAEVQLHHVKGQHPAEAAKLKASSQLVADADASYGPDGLADNLRDTMWCEGKPEAGLNESITWTFAQPVSLGAVKLLSGVASSQENFGRNNRPSRVRLEFGGKTQELAVEDSFGALQNLALEGTSGTSLKLTVLDVYKGSQFNDTCISEVQLVPRP